MDNRIKFEPTKIDFENEVGVTGQLHDNYPKANEQARYDWHRLYLIGLLSHQSSSQPPFEYRTGTIWYSLDNEFYYYWDGQEWAGLANGIKITIDGSTMTLQQWADYMVAENKETGTGVIEGTAAIAISVVPIPTYMQGMAAKTNSRAILYKNGLIIDPHLVNYSTDRKNVVLTGDAVLNNGDEYIITIQRVDIMN